MLLFASLVGGWDKLELWDHTHLELLGLLFLVAIAEVILFKLIVLAGLFPRSSDHYNSEYNDSQEYEDIFYYENDFTTRNYGQWPQSEIIYHQQQPQEQQHIFHHYNDDQDYNSYDVSYNNQFFNNQLTTSTGIFRYVY